MSSIYNCTGHEMKIPNIVNSRGMYLFDEDGKRYMDLESGVWCTALGHNNTRINKAITQQTNSLMHSGFCYSNNIVEEAAKAVLALTNFEDGKCVFLCSGSEAIELSRQIAKQITQKKLSLTLHDSYLGSYSSVIRRSEGWYTFDWENCQRCINQEQCNPFCEALQAIPYDVSEFIFEPGSSSGFVRFPPKAMIQNLVHTIRQKHGIIIVNEVTTGIGRTGKWFGYQHYDIEPDIVVMGKGIGNGYPVSVMALNQATVEELNETPFKYAQSHQNDPLGAAVVREVIQVILDDDLIAQAKENGAKFLKKMQSLVEHKHILDVRGRGLMFAVDLVDEQVGNEIFSELLEQGYIVCNRKSVFRIDPPLIITEHEFQEFIDAFRRILSSRE